MDIIIILALALAIDLAAGEPPNSWHPVAWLGRLISSSTGWTLRRGRAGQLVFGAMIVLLTLGLVAVPLYFLLAYLQPLHWAIYGITAVVLLKFTFSLRGLRQAATEVRELLAGDNIAEARISLRSLVSRDTADLDESQVVSATVESVAENICDSFVAPLFYFLLLGVPGAVAYRIINTFDAMIGYHGEWEYSGKFAARLDDIANFIPARITALLIVLAAWIRKKDRSGAWKIMLRDRRKTQSPNAGWTMGAIAGALGVQLEKTGCYKLGDNHYARSLNTIDASLQITSVVALIWSLISVLAEVTYIAAT